MSPIIQDGELWYSEEFQTASHLCACGCGSRTITPIDANNWTLQISEDGYTFTLSLSIGNYQYPCGSHYSIVDSKVVWYKLIPK